MIQQGGAESVAVLACRPCLSRHACIVHPTAADNLPYIAFHDELESSRMHCML